MALTASPAYRETLTTSELILKRKLFMTEFLFILIVRLLNSGFLQYLLSIESDATTIKLLYFTISFLDPVLVCVGYAFMLYSVWRFGLKHARGFLLLAVLSYVLYFTFDLLFNYQEYPSPNLLNVYLVWEIMNLFLNLAIMAVILFLILFLRKYSKGKTRISRFFLSLLLPLSIVAVNLFPWFDTSYLSYKGASLSCGLFQTASLQNVLKSILPSSQSFLPVLFTFVIYTLNLLMILACIAFCITALQKKQISQKFARLALDSAILLFLFAFGYLFLLNHCISETLHTYDSPIQMIFLPYVFFILALLTRIFIGYIWPVSFYTTPQEIIPYNAVHTVKYKEEDGSPSMYKNTLKKILWIFFAYTFCQMLLNLILDGLPVSLNDYLYIFLSFAFSMFGILVIVLGSSYCIRTEKNIDQYIQKIAK